MVDNGYSGGQLLQWWAMVTMVGNDYNGGQWLQSWAMVTMVGNGCIGWEMDTMVDNSQQLHSPLIRTRGEMTIASISFKIIEQ